MRVTPRDGLGELRNSVEIGVDMRERDRRIRIVRSPNRAESELVWVRISCVVRSKRGRQPRKRGSPGARAVALRVAVRPTAALMQLGL